MLLCQKDVNDEPLKIAWRIAPLEQLDEHFVPNWISRTDQIRQQCLFDVEKLDLPPRKVTKEMADDDLIKQKSDQNY